MSGRTRAVGVCLTACVLLTGCSSIRVKFGQRIRLASLPVTRISVSLSDGDAIAPGERIPLVVTLEDANGKAWQTEGAGHGKILWSELDVTSEVVGVTRNGVAVLDSDPRVSEGKTGRITVRVPSHPTLVADVDLPLRYDYAYRASFQGRSGTDGFSGTDGTSGLSGSTGSFGPDGKPGGDGSDGTNGTSGSDGGNGERGPRVTVRATMQGSNPKLLQVAVTEGESGAIVTGRRSNTTYYLLDPNGGSLTVTSAGGAGGRGGKGGKGGRGGSGGSGTPSGRDGRNGQDGSDGHDGWSGPDGPVWLLYDPSARNSISCIHIPDVRNVREESVPALW